MKNPEGKYKYLWAVIFGFLLTGYTVFTLLDTFVIPRDMVYIDDLPKNTSSDEITALTAATAEEANSQASEITQEVTTEALTAQETTIVEETEPFLSEPIITDRSYRSNNISIVITERRVHDTQVYIADIILKNPGCLKTGLANGAFGRNLKQYTSTIAKNCGAIFAVNGDYYGFRESGYVMREGFLYREVPRSGDNCDGLAVFEDGGMEAYKETEIEAQALADRGAVQLFCFGPTLIDDSKITVDEDSEVSMSMNSNPRTAIGYVAPLHYKMVVSDGRTEESRGLSLLQLAQVMREEDCEVAYNLDGGGSTSMWFMGEIVNVPTNGSHMGERGVSDIVYIGE